MRGRGIRRSDCGPQTTDGHPSPITCSPAVAIQPRLALICPSCSGALPQARKSKCLWVYSHPQATANPDTNTVATPAVPSFMLLVFIVLLTLFFQSCAVQSGRVEQRVASLGRTTAAPSQLSSAAVDPPVRPIGLAAVPMDSADQPTSPITPDDVASGTLAETLGLAKNLYLGRIYAGGGGVLELVSGDFNEDGHIDFAGSGSQSSLLFGRGDGSFPHSTNLNVNSLGAPPSPTSTATRTLTWSSWGPTRDSRSYSATVTGRLANRWPTRSHNRPRLTSWAT